ncbi:cadherin-like beta sandwich domain-containing protein [Clostridium sp. YIM B02505]|uniref:Cadherin-like beta sandwich domain-containing protein n=1 Tax=Clostridium yunnanense TaxID=2800325 RepID=A0ABS1EJK5_9CLOT|nr:cadherin-like beta sandwich domain-containing protein [Clostridium yunnanense]MBK1809553.1 cadherin-like beta sandwich domain-containing protein [Clostridium yunnanense]
MASQRKKLKSLIAATITTAVMLNTAPLQVFAFTGTTMSQTFSQEEVQSALLDVNNAYSSDDLITVMIQSPALGIDMTFWASTPRADQVNIATKLYNNRGAGYMSAEELRNAFVQYCGEEQKMIDINTAPDADAVITAIDYFGIDLTQFNYTWANVDRIAVANMFLDIRSDYGFVTPQAVENSFVQCINSRKIAMVNIAQRSEDIRYVFEHIGIQVDFHTNGYESLSDADKTKVADLVIQDRELHGVFADNGAIQTSVNKAVTSVKAVNTPVLSGDNKLRDIQSDKGVLSPVFDPEKTDYTLNVDNATTMLYVTLTTNEAHSHWSITSDNDADIDNLKEGHNVFHIKVTAQNGAIRTYNLDVIRESSIVQKSNDSRLSNIAVDKGSLSPAFDASIASYSVNVANDVTEINITPTVNEEHATVGVYPLDNCDAKNLKVGHNYFKVGVVAQDGSLRNYIVDVVRAVANVQTDAEKVQQAYDRLAIGYAPGDSASNVNMNIQLPFSDENGATVTWYTTDSNYITNIGEVKNGRDGLVHQVIMTALINCGGASLSKLFELNVQPMGGIVVTTPKSSDATLTNIIPSSGVLSPTFNPLYNINYSVVVENDITSLTLTPLLHNSKASYVIEGVENASLTALVQGYNYFNIKVTAESGAVRYYPIVVVRLAPTPSEGNGGQPTGGTTTPTEGNGGQPTGGTTTPTEGNGGQPTGGTITPTTPGSGTITPNTNPDNNQTKTPANVELTTKTDGVTNGAYSDSKISGMLDGKDTLVVKANGIVINIPEKAVDTANLDGSEYIRVTEKILDSTEASELFKGLPSGIAPLKDALSFTMQLFDKNGILIKDIHQFANGQKVKISIKLTADQIAGKDTSKLTMYYYDETKKEWVEIGGSFDKGTMLFSFETSHFTNFAILEKVTTPTTTPTTSTPTEIVKLPQTGSVVDFSSVVVAGSFMMVLGAVVLFVNKRK